MTYLMRQGVAKVVWRRRSSWNAGVEHDDAIVLRGARIARWEGCVCKEFDIRLADAPS